jgi:hypothetical protein
VFLLFYACWPAIGWDWGSRHLLVVLPAAAVLAGLGTGLGRTRALAALFALGFLINGPSLVSLYERYLSGVQESRGETDALLWSVPDSPALRAIPNALAQVREASATDLRELVARQKNEPASARAHRGDALVFKVIPAWWWFCPVLGVPRAASYLAMAVLLGAALALILSEIGRSPRAHRSGSRRDP